MAVSPTYPGVYVTETASIPHIVTPATTNLTAFLGAFPRGSTTEAPFVTSFGEFQAEFGPLTATSSYAAYAVSQFFANGGLGAWIVRLTSEAAVAASVSLTPALAPDAAVVLSASSAGAWGDDLTVEFVASGPAASPSTTHMDLVVAPPTPASGKAPAALETIGGIQMVKPDGTTVSSVELAQIIDNRSTYLSAAPPAADATPGAAATDPTPLAGGVDPDLTGAGFEDAINAELQSPGGRLDQLAPNVFNLMCIPDLPLQAVGVQQTVIGMANLYCEERQAFLIVDPPPPAAANTGAADTIDNIGAPGAPGLAGLLTTWGEALLTPENYAAAAYYPWVQITDPVTTLPKLVPPSGTIAGVYATTDVNRGVWKAPAGAEAGMVGVTGLADTTISDTINGDLNVVGINALRTFPLYGSVVWGTRTLAGSDLGGSAFKYVPVRRLTDFIEQSLQQSLKWAVFEPNGPALWASVSLEVTAFMSGLFGAGAFAGASAASAYTVACDASTTSPNDMLEGIVNVNVGFAPVDPAEFVMLNIQINAASAAS